MLSDFVPSDFSEIILPPLKHESGYGLEKKAFSFLVASCIFATSGPIYLHSYNTFCWKLLKLTVFRNMVKKMH